MSGRPGTYDHHFAINPQTGVVTHTEVVDRAVTSQFEITIKVGLKSLNHYSNKCNMSRCDIVAVIFIQVPLYQATQQITFPYIMCSG